MGDGPIFRSGPSFARVWYVEIFCQFRRLLFHDENFIMLILCLVHVKAEETGHNFRGKCILLSCIICNVLFLLTQQVDLGCMGIHCSLW